MPQPGDAFGRYQITGRLGRGGMGVVFSARQVDLNRDVALKLLSPDLAESEEYRHRFVREAGALGRLDSQHVITVHDAGEHDGWLYIATQLIPGGDLAHRLATNGPFAPMEALDILAQAADGLADAHEAGIIHRDLKPSNILLRDRADGSVTAYLCDLGIARSEGSEHTRTTGVIGTLGYMAPERHQGQPATMSSDIYAMGCLLWALLSGRAPWTGTDLGVALGHLQEPIPQLDPSVPGASYLNPLLLTSMSKLPEHRFQSARALRHALLETSRALAADRTGTVPVIDPRTVPAPAPTPTPTPTPTPYPVTAQYQPHVHIQAEPAPYRPQPYAPQPFQPLQKPFGQQKVRNRRSRAPWIVLLVLLIVAGVGGGIWALVEKAKRDRLSPVASAISQLSGDRISYNLGSDSADCAADQVINQTGATDSGTLGGDLSAKWPSGSGSGGLDSSDADIVAAAVIDCSSQVYNSIVSDLVQGKDSLEQSCERPLLTETVVKGLLSDVLSGSVSAFDSDLDDTVAGC